MEEKISLMLRFVRGGAFGYHFGNTVYDSETDAVFTTTIAALTALRRNPEATEQDLENIMRAHVNGLREHPIKYKHTTLAQVVEARDNAARDTQRFLESYRNMDAWAKEVKNKNENV